ncbi:MAG: hypothetical protein IEMM0002_0213 [bacterium]|nr:MAG: hypothetical protein IEMM0002_0213 [bacterium]
MLSASGCITAEVFSLNTSNTSPAPDGMVHVTKITYSTVENGTSVKVYATGRLEYTSYKLSNPFRLAVEIPNVLLDFEPERINLDDPNISSLNVVRFPKVDSIRLELELYANVSFNISPARQYLEIVVLGTSGKKSPQPAVSKEIVADSGEMNNPPQRKETLDKLREENNNLKLEILQKQKGARELEEENKLIQQESAKNRHRMEEAIGRAKNVNARNEFLEKKLSRLQETKPNALPPVAGFLKQGGALPSPILLASDKGAFEDMDEDSKASVKDIRNMLSGWLLAWNRKDFDTFSAYYSQDFKAGIISRGKWLRDKKRKFAKPGRFEINAKKLEVNFMDANSAVVIFDQVFKSSYFSDRGTKALTLTKEDADWKILSESWKPF